MPTFSRLAATLACCAGLSVTAEESTAPAATLLDSTSLEQAFGAVSWGAYGEAHYSNFQSNGKADMLDLHRLVLLSEAQLAERWRFIAEIEFEHALIGEGKPGEVEVEQALVEFTYAGAHAVQAGMMLVPISIGNLYHEPTIFHGVERPLFDSRIVPTTWFDIGVAAHGPIIAGLDYTVALQTGVNGQNLSASNGFRSGRQKGAEAKAQDLMITGRLDYRPFPSTWLSVAVNAGGIDQRTQDEGELDSDSVTGTLAVAEARWADFGWETGVSLGQGQISDPQELGATLPETFRGVSVFAAYDVLRLTQLDTAHQLFVFARYEKLDNNASMANGVPQNEALNTRSYQYGLTWKPNAHVVGKFDYQDIENDDGSGSDVWSLGVGFAF